MQGARFIRRMLSSGGTTFFHPSSAHNFMTKIIFKSLHLSLAIFIRTSKRKKEAPPHRGLETDRLKDR
jgi:hypothetical protein